MKFSFKIYHRIPPIYIMLSDLQLQWNLVIKRSDITKPSYNKVVLLVPALYISLFFDPDSEKPDITR